MEMDQEIESKLEKNKRKHITLTIQEKLDIINLVESGTCSRQAIANRYGIGKSTVHDIHKSRDKLRVFALEKSTDNLAKRRRVDVKMERNLAKEYDFKDEIVEEETLVEHFDNEEFDYANEQEYEIIYEQNLSEDSDSKMVQSSETETNQKPEKNKMPKKNQNSGKRKSKTLTLKQKCEILKQLEEGESVIQICKLYDIGRTTVYDFIKNKQKIFEYVEKSMDESRRTFKKSNYPQIEGAMNNWCRINTSFTKQQFYENCKVLFEQVKELTSQNASLPSPPQFSWSWCKRFLDRNAHFKRKLITANGDDSNLSEFTPNKNESFDNSSIVKIDEVLDESILSIKNEIENDSFNKYVRYPELENELLVWCLEQNIPSNEIIFEKAISLFESIGYSGRFNITLDWVKKFIKRYPELYERNIQKHTTNGSINQAIIEYECDNNVTSESLEFIEHEYLPMDDHDEEEENTEDDDYIVEELDQETQINDDDDEIIVEEHEDTRSIEITDEEALKSLKLLIKYSEQRGHDKITNLLVQYQDEIVEDAS